jgi:hypothetical protein
LEALEEPEEQPVGTNLRRDHRRAKRTHPSHPPSPDHDS